MQLRSANVLAVSVCKQCLNAEQSGDASHAHLRSAAVQIAHLQSGCRGSQPAWLTHRRRPWTVPALSCAKAA